MKLNESRCARCDFSEQKFSSVMEDNIEKDRKIVKLEQKVVLYKSKYKKYKEKFAETGEALNKIQSSENSAGMKYVNECSVWIGASLSVLTQKLTCCRTSDFSKYTADLLDVVFGPEQLARF